MTVLDNTLVSAVTTVLAYKNVVQMVDSVLTHFNLLFNRVCFLQVHQTHRGCTSCLVSKRAVTAHREESVWNQWNDLFLMSGHTKICRHHGTHGTHGTDFIGCRRGKGGASTGTGAVRDQCHVTKLKELYRHPGATVCWQNYSPYCYNAEVTNKRWKPTMSEQ